MNIFGRFRELRYIKYIYVNQVATPAMTLADGLIADHHHYYHTYRQSMPKYVQTPGELKSVKIVSKVLDKCYERYGRDYEGTEKCLTMLFNSDFFWD